MSDHLISRSRFLDALVLDADNKTDLIQVHQALEKAVISPDEVRGVGEWIKAHDDVCWWWECSECHEQPLQRYKYDRLSNYCPSCGARMEVSGDA